MSQPKPWHVDSWRSKPAKQQVEYADQEIFETTVKRIQQLPPLISKGEVLELRKQLAEVAAGQRFLLQGMCLLLFFIFGCVDYFFSFVVVVFLFLFIQADQTHFFFSFFFSLFLFLFFHSGQRFLLSKVVIVQNVLLIVNLVPLNKS